MTTPNHSNIIYINAPGGQVTVNGSKMDIADMPPSLEALPSKSGQSGFVRIGLAIAESAMVKAFTNAVLRSLGMR